MTNRTKKIFLSYVIPRYSKNIIKRDIIEYENRYKNARLRGAGLYKGLLFSSIMEVMWVRDYLIGMGMR